MNNTHKYLTKIDAKFLDEVSHLMQVDARNAKTRKPSQNPHMLNLLNGNDLDLSAELRV